ncbi:MAG: hypothetical protein AB7E52_04400 [Bdellovibrionales bacterium]
MIRLIIAFFLFFGLIGAAGPVAARDAAFMDPGASVSRTGPSPDSVVVEPKSDVDVGDTPSNIGRRATFFFVNRTSALVHVESVAANGDSNVRADIVSDDCSKGKTIAAGNRCAITVEVTPNGSGSWTAEILMTHDAVGRITRARVLGRTTASSTDKRDMGLSLNTKDVKPVNFGDVVVGTGKAARSALMINDSNDIISILSIEVIAADNGLTRLDQGCEPDMDLNPGESCPVTLVWEPTKNSNISTDLIIRHSGRLGFAVIPIRGTAKEIEQKDGTSKASSSPSPSSGAPLMTGKSKTSIAPPSVSELDAALNAGNIPPLSGMDLPEHLAKIEPLPPEEADLTMYHLIGTVGNRAIIYKPDGDTAIVAVGDPIEKVGEQTVKLVYISPTDAEISAGSKKHHLTLETVSALTHKAAESAKQHQSDETDKKSSSKKRSKKSSKDNVSDAVPLPAVNTSSGKR